jgi:phosphoglycerol transferase MdoB-like AlkP superfamily enzyme
MSNKACWFLFILYLALAGSYCGLEIDTFLGDTPLFRGGTLFLLCNVLCVMLVPPIVCALCPSKRSLRDNRALRNTIMVLNAIYFHIAVFLALYKAIRKLDFDFYFFWYNTADALPTLWKLYAPWFPVVILLIAAFILLQRAAFSPLKKSLTRSPHKGWTVLLALFFLSVTCQLATIHKIRGSAAGFLYASFFSDRQLRNDYSELYRRNIAALQSDAPAAAGRIDPALMGDVIFIIKQESLNGFLLSPRVTPQLLRASRDGILFPKFYANSIQSLRGYECILCGVPPSIAGTLVDDYSAAELKNLQCLPKIFKSLGYHPLYFFGGSRNARIVHFAESIGFEKVLADDIAQPEDVKFDWGYREDVFFTRMHEYLQRHYVNEKLFIFVDTGATNHAPFDVLDDALLDKIPFPQPKRFHERLSNTTFVQDAYFGKLYDIYAKNYANRGSLVVISDHAWPAMMHQDNIYNERGAFEENFLIPLLFVPPASKRELFATGTVVEQRFSQMDIPPAVLELIGMKQKDLLGESFAPWLLADPQKKRAVPEKLKISVQPYGGGFISAVRYPEKYLFYVLGRNVKVYDLAKDPQEQSPAIREAKSCMPLIRDFFRTR